MYLPLARSFVPPRARRPISDGVSRATMDASRSRARTRARARTRTDARGDRHAPAALDAGDPRGWVHPRFMTQPQGWGSLRRTFGSTPSGDLRREVRHRPACRRLPRGIVRASYSGRLERRRGIATRRRARRSRARARRVARDPGFGLHVTRARGGRHARARWR